MEEILLDAIHKKNIVSITFNSQEKGLIGRLCIPFDIGPSRRYKDGEIRYHFYDLDSPEGEHNLSILPGQLENIELTNETFNPGDYVTWQKISWFVPRDWGEYS